MRIFVTMRIKKGIVFLLLGVFLMAKMEPVFPYLKQLPKVTHNLIRNITVLCNGNGQWNTLADNDPAEADNNAAKDAEKEAEKEADKSVKEESKIVLKQTDFAAIFHTDSNRTLFHLYVFGKTRNHIDEVFRPPLV
jgi:hypothetical protein